MIAKALAAALLFASSAAVPQTAQPQPSVPLVRCDDVAGSAFRIGPHLLVTAKHVSANEGCKIDGVPLKVTYSSKDQDYALLSDDRAGAFFKVDCGGFQKGRTYVAIGHARGLPQLTAISLMGTGVKDGWGFSVLVGIFTVIPGQSGGVIMDAETGAAVGIVNTYNMENGWSGSIALADTSVCEGKK